VLAGPTVGSAVYLEDRRSAATVRPVRGSAADGGVAVVLASAFPAALGGDVRAATKIIPAARLMPQSSFSVALEGESVTIPYRLYNAEPASEAQTALSPVQKAILDCIYTRHHDGRVRHRRLEQIIGSTQPWVIPFVVQLVGEYVAEIIVAIREGLADLDRPGTSQHAAYGQFLVRNPDFLALTGQRVDSYWDCYYRAVYRERSSYPGYVLLGSFRSAASAYLVANRSLHRPLE
jgi:hypothetical protein